MLLYNLPLEPGGGCRVAFGDSQEDAAKHEPGTAPSTAAGSSPPGALVDVSSLSLRLEKAMAELGHERLEDLPLCSHLGEFRAEIEEAAAGGAPAQATGRADATGHKAEAGEEGDGEEEAGYESDGYDDNGEAGDLQMHFDEDEAGAEESFEMGGFSPTRSPAKGGNTAASAPTALEAALGHLDVAGNNDYAFFDMR